MSNFEIPIFLRKRMSYFNLKERAQHSVKENLYLKIFFFIEIYLKTFGLQISKIELKKFNGPIVTHLNNDDLNENAKKQSYNLFKKKIAISEEIIDNVDNILIQQTAKDKANLSNLAYSAYRNRLQGINCKMFSAHKLNVFKKKMNQFFIIKSNRIGCFVDCKEKIEYTLKKIYENFTTEKKRALQNTFKIHLSGDGCNITKTKFNIINFTFKVLSENVQNTSGLYTLGITQYFHYPFFNFIVSVNS